MRNAKTLLDHGFTSAYSAATAQRTEQMARVSPMPHIIAITGRDTRQGFLQRLAVAPEHQGQGLGTALVLDALYGGPPASEGDLGTSQAAYGGAPPFRPDGL